MTAVFGMPFGDVIALGDLVADGAPRGVTGKVAAIRKAQLEVEKKRDEDTAVSWGEAAAVFARVNPLLDRYGLVVRPATLGEPSLTFGKTSAKVLACVRIVVRLIDTTVPADHVDRETVSEWAGELWLDADSPEPGGIAGAITQALKGWYVHTFAVKLIEPDRTPGKTYKVAGARKVSKAQVDNLIGAALKENGLSGEQGLALANELCDEAIDGLGQLPRDAADDLIDLIKMVGARERAKARASAAGGGS